MAERFIWPFPHHDNPVYWQLPNDGDTFTCNDCNKKFKHTEVILTQIPIDNSRRVICNSCIDEDWLKGAENLGKYKD